MDLASEKICTYRGMISAAFFAIVGVDRSIFCFYFLARAKKINFEKLGQSCCHNRKNRFNPFVGLKNGWGRSPVKTVSKNFTKSLYGNIFFRITTKKTVIWGYRGKTRVLPR